MLFEALIIFDQNDVSGITEQEILIETNPFEEVYSVSKERKITLRTTAYIIAVSRIVKAIELRGIFP